MITFNLIRFSTIFRWTLAVSVLIIPQLVQAQWQVRDVATISSH